MGCTRRWVGAVVAVLSLLAAGCGGSRGTDTSTGDGTTATTGASTSSGSFGTLPSPCGPGDASGATDQGVTDTAIHIGFGDDAGYQGSPGLDHQVSDAMRAFIAWCNDQGGINGRPVDGTYYDAKVTEVTNVMAEACTKEFFLVGQLFVLDDGQEPTRRGCALPAVPAAAGTALFANAPLKWEAVPSAIDRSSVYGGIQLAEMYPDAVKNAAVLYGDYAVMKDRKDQVVEAFTSLGWNFKPECSMSYNIAGEADWKPFVQKLQSCGAQAVYYVGAPAPALENILDAAHQFEFEPIWYADTNSYDTSFAAWNRDGFADRVYFRMGFVPFEEAGQVPVVQQFLDIVDANGGDPNQLGQQAASSFLLWATAAKACGSDLTRECVSQQLDRTHEWDGGGMHGSADPGNNEPTRCGVLMKLDGTAFVRVTPEQAGTLDCDPSHVVAVTGDVVTRHDIGADRIAPLS